MFYNKNNRAVYQCRGCGKDITFSDSIKSKNGKAIPLNAKTLAKHRCVARPFNKYTRREWWYEQRAKAEREREQSRREKGPHLEDIFVSSYSRRYAEILGVSINAGEEEIKQAYRKKMLEYHPDRNSTMSWEESNRKTAELNEAYANFNL